MHTTITVSECEHVRAVTIGAQTDRPFVDLQLAGPKNGHGENAEVRVQVESVEDLDRLEAAVAEARKVFPRFDPAWEGRSWADEMRAASHGVRR